MTRLELDLDRLRERLRLAIAADLRRRARRRRRVMQLALVPGLALTAAGVAFAVVPVLNQPAPPRVQQSFDELRTLDPPTRRTCPRAASSGCGRATASYRFTAPCRRRGLRARLPTAA